MPKVIELLESLRDYEGHICIHDLPEDFNIVEEGDWTQENKFQHAEHILVNVASGRHFCLNQGRSGSYHSDWHYYSIYLCEVKQVTETVVVTKWVQV